MPDLSRQAREALAEPGARSVRARVELGPDATVTLETDGEEPAVLEPDTVTALFSAGLHAPARERSVEPSGSSRLVLDGDARFLVGTLDLGRKRGMRVIMRGLAFTLGAVKRDIDMEHSAPPGAPSPAATPELDRDTPLEPSPMSVGELADAFDDMFARVRAGGRVIITELEKPVAVMTSWRWYCQQRELLASLDAAQWRAAVSGRFNSEVYAAALRDFRSETATVRSIPTTAVGSGEPALP
ncbi:hypothetical protein ASE38_01565 [Cellulomonas sp. Root930]|nr:hypothetical protein ASE38_01565 [Cellulomonas sp. Root930]